MPSPPPLQPGCYYHIFNRGINGEDLFPEERNYEYFLRLYSEHMSPVVDTFAYCLMKNHFHLAIRVKETGADNAVHSLPPASQGFASLFNAFTKAINKARARTGGLFENPYRRINIHSDAYFMRLIRYIHRNPQKHGFVKDFRDWKWSSYHAILSNKHTRVQRAAVLAWFDGPTCFVRAHEDTDVDAVLLDQDFD